MPLMLSILFFSRVVRIRTPLCVVSAICGLALAASASIIPQSGFSGRPGDGTCRDCHPVKSLLDPDSLILAGLPDTLEPGTVYSCTLYARYHGLNEWTFELTAVDSLSNQAGTITVTDSEHTEIDNFLDVQYFKNNLKGAYVNRKDSTSWTFDYLSPPATTGPVSFYWCSYFKNRAKAPYYLLQASRTIPLRQDE
jgi:hypothetical protein